MINKIMLTLVLLFSITVKGIAAEMLDGENSKPIKIQGVWNTKSNINESDCSALDKFVEENKTRINACLNDPQNILCRSFLVFWTTEKRIMKIYPDYPSYWMPKIAQNPPEIRDDLKYPYFENVVELEYLENSFFSKYHGSPLFDEKIDRPIYNGKSIYTLNRFLDCDLRRGNIKVTSQFTRKILVTLPVDALIKKAAFDIYNNVMDEYEANNLSAEESLVQAALLGSIIDKSIKESGVKDDTLTIKKLFLSFFELKTRRLVPKEFVTQADFDKRMFTDVTVQKDVTFQWSNM